MHKSAKVVVVVVSLSPPPTKMFIVLPIEVKLRKMVLRARLFRQFVEVRYKVAHNISEMLPD